MFSRDKVVFIDRDGVINKDPAGWTEHDYITKTGDFHFLPDVLRALKNLTENKYKIIIISNQAGVGKGYFTVKELEKVSDYMLKEIEVSGGKISGVYYCIHTKEDNCDCRKPKTGLFKKASGNINFDIGNTYLIGDSPRDIEAGKSFGLKTILVLSGKTHAENLSKLEVRPDEIKKDLNDAAEFIIRSAK